MAARDVLEANERTPLVGTIAFPVAVFHIIEFIVALTIDVVNYSRRKDISCLVIRTYFLFLI